MQFGQVLLLATGIMVLSIRISGHSPDFSFYLFLELCAYALLVHKFLWRDIHTTAIKDIRTQRLLPKPAVETDSVLSSISESLDSPGSKDSLQEVLFPSPTRPVLDYKLTATPLFRPVLVGFAKPMTRSTSPKRVSSLLKPTKLPQERIPPLHLPSQFDPEKAPVKEMNAFEEAALKQLTEITKKVNDAVKAAETQEREKDMKTPLPIVLEHSPSVIDLPIVAPIRNPDPEPILKMELVEMGSGEKEEKPMEQPMTVEHIGNGSFSVQNPVLNAEIPLVEGQTNTRRTFQPLRLYHKTEEERNVEMTSAAPQETYASRLSALPPEDTRISSSFFLDSSKSSNPPIQLAVSPSLTHLLEHISNKTNAFRNLRTEIKEETVKFAYSIYPGSDSTFHSRFRAFQLIVDASVRTSTDLLYYLVDRMLLQTEKCFSSLYGLAYADCLVHHISVMSQEWTSLEDIFISELLASEPILSSVSQADFQSNDTLRNYSSKASLSIGENLLKTYNYATLYGFLMRKRSKVSIAEAWSLLASYMNSPIISYKTAPAIAGLLRVVGFDMERDYQTQLIKLVNLVLNVYIPELKSKFPQEEVAVYILELGQITKLGKFKDPMERERLS